MRLSTLRRQLLVAMGLPVTIGCGASPPPGGGGGGDGTGSGTDRITIGSGSGDGEIGNEAPDWHEGDACTIDMLPESICGGAVDAQGKGACYGHGDNLTSYGNSSLWITQGSYGSHDAAFASFVFDQAATDAYRTSLASNNLPLDQYCCFSQCTGMRVASSAPLDVPPGYRTDQVCIPAPPAGTSAPSADAPDCPGAVELQGAMRPMMSGYQGTCCYGVVVEDPPEIHYRGRPARVDGVAKLPDTAATEAWCAMVDVAIPEDVRGKLAAAWTEAARLEHASIASFSGLALELMAAGAPPALIEAAHRAALDEIAHARVAFGLASAYAGAPVGPAPFAAARELGGGDLRSLAIACVVDGCVGETVAAVEAARAADAATDPVVADALRVIAEDEARHAELAWSIVAWALRADPGLAPAMETALARASAPRELPDGDDLSAHGVLPPQALAALRAEVLREVVEPCARALRLG